MYLEKIVMQSSSHSCPMKTRDHILKLLNVYACWIEGYNDGDMGILDWDWSIIVLLLAAVTMGPLAGRTLVQCCRASLSR